MRKFIDIVEAAQQVPSYPIAPRDEWHGNMNYANDGGRMVQMSPDEYLSKVRPLVIDEISRENIDDLKDHILSGRTLDPLVIYSDGKEDGRHRANAAKELGIREVPVIVFGQALAEQFVSGFQINRISKRLPIEVFKNPSRAEWKACESYDAIRAMIVADDLYIWSFEALHAEVAEHMQFPNTCIPVILYGEYKDEVHAQVTDYSKRTVWHLDGEVGDAIRSALEDFGFTDVEVGYYNSDIVGDWGEEDEDDDEELNESHDYNPEWDYEIVEPDPKIAMMVEEIMATIRAKMLPKLGFSDVKIFYSDDLGGAVGIYIYGTSSLPVFGVDVTSIEEGTMSPADFKRELAMTIVHELAHAYQESIGVLNDESGCDDPDLEYAAEAFAEDFIHHGFVNVSVLRRPLGED